MDAPSYFPLSFLAESSEQDQSIEAAILRLNTVTDPAVVTKDYLVEHPGFLLR
jgi:hypothetical protein